MRWVLRIVAALVAMLVVAFLIFRTPDTDPAQMLAKYGGAPSQFVEIGGGVTVHLRDEGPKDAPAIILLHGSNSDLHTWQPWVDDLSADYRVIRFDQVGHGLTGPDRAGDYSRANYVEDIREIADALGLDRFILAGNSMGGKHALAFASAYPDRVAGLVLVDAGGMPIPEEEKDEDSGSGNIGFAIARTPGINLIAEQITPRSLIRQSSSTERIGAVGRHRSGGGPILGSAALSRQPRRHYGAFCRALRSADARGNRRNRYADVDIVGGRGRADSRVCGAVA